MRGARDVLRARQPRFVLVGVYNTVFGFACFALLVHLLHDEVHYIALLLISHVISTLNAYLGHRYVVFRVRGHFFRDLFRFWSVYLVSIGINVAALPVAVDGLGVPLLIAQAGITLALVVLTYVLHSRFSFARGPAAPLA